MTGLLGLLFATLYFCLCAAESAAAKHFQKSFIPHHVATDPTTTSSSSPDVTTPPVDATPWQLLGIQCSLGANFSSLTLERDATSPGTLYVEFEVTAPCAGIVSRWYICFMRSGMVDSDDGVDFVVLRFDQSQGNYIIIDIHKLRFSRELVSDTTQCDYIANSDGRVRLEEGDVLGFMNRGSIRIAVASLPEGTGSTLRSFQLAPRRGGPAPDQMQESLMVNDSIQQDRFDPSTRQVTSLIRAILDSTGPRSTEAATPSPSASNAPPCNQLNGQDRRVQGSALFISVTSAAGIVILTLTAIVLCMACCLCQRHCYKLSCPRSKKKRVTHTIRVEPMFEHSMQYNDMYEPSDQEEVISRGEKHTTRIQSNPAYNTSPIRNTNAESHLSRGGRHSQGGEELEYATTTFSKPATPKWPLAGLARVDTTQEELEHTYEVIKSMKLSSQ